MVRLLRSEFENVIVVAVKPNSNIPYFAFPYGSLRDRTFLAEYEAMQVSDQYFACEGGVNQNLVSGAILRIGAHNESESELIKLLLRQYVR